MRYSRVLTVLALVGLVALTTTLLTHTARSAPKSVRPAATNPTLQSMLQQSLQQFLASHPPPRPRAPSLNLPFSARTCPVASGPCSGNPCVYFVQNGSQPAAPVSESVQNTITPTLPGGLGSQGCTRHALPQTLRVSSALSGAVSLSVPQPAPRRGS